MGSLLDKLKGGRSSRPKGRSASSRGKKGGKSRAKSYVTPSRRR